MLEIRLSKTLADMVHPGKLRRPLLGSAMLLLATLVAGCSGGGRETGPPVAPADAEAALVNLIEQRRQAVIADESSADAWGELGMAFDAHRMKEQAARCYARAQELDPESPAWPYHLGMQITLDDLAAALACFERVIELEDGSATAWARLGHARLASDQLDGALEAFSAAIKLQPTWPALFIARAQVELARGEAGTALGDLERALEGEVQSGEVHSLMAEAYRRVGQQERADASAALAGDNLGTEPVPDTWRNQIRNHVVTYGLLKPMSDSYVKAGRLDEAQGCWSRVLQYDPESVRAHRERAFVQVLRGDTDAALVGFDRAASIAAAGGDRSIQAEVACVKGAAFLRVRDTERAIKAFEEALELDPQLHKARGDLGAILSGGPDVERGLELLQAVCAAMPDQAEAHFNLGMALFGLQRLSEARDAFGRATQLSAEMSPAHFQLGMCWAREGDWGQAALAFGRAAEADPKHESTWSNWARALRRSGRWVDAVMVQTDAVAQLPEATELKRSLAWDLATAPDEEARDGVMARKLSEELNREAGFKDPRLLDNLAAVYAEIGLFEGARAHLEKAIGILSAMDASTAPRARPTILRAMRQRLASYEAERAWREAP